MERLLAKEQKSLVTNRQSVAKNYTQWQLKMTQSIKLVAIGDGGVVCMIYV
jgi:hypothetical protein